MPEQHYEYAEWKMARLGRAIVGTEIWRQRLEAVCACVIKHSAVSRNSVQAILKNGLDLQQQREQRVLNLLRRENLREGSTSNLYRSME